MRTDRRTHMTKLAVALRNLGIKRDVINLRARGGGPRGICGGQSGPVWPLVFQFYGQWSFRRLSRYSYAVTQRPCCVAQLCAGGGGGLLRQIHCLFHRVL
jgi:hypothetical protein